MTKALNVTNVAQFGRKPPAAKAALTSKGIVK